LTGEIGKRLGAQWREMSAEEKAVSIVTIKAVVAAN
jgi:hypothetical protein